MVGRCRYHQVVACRERNVDKARCNGFCMPYQADLICGVASFRHQCHTVTNESRLHDSGMFTTRSFSTQP